jgi:hypothetical protein
MNLRAPLLSLLHLRLSEHIFGSHLCKGQSNNQHHPRIHIHLMNETSHASTQGVQPLQNPQRRVSNQDESCHTNSSATRNRQRNPDTPPGQRDKRPNGMTGPGCALERTQYGNSLPRSVDQTWPIRNEIPKTPTHQGSNILETTASTKHTPPTTDTPIVGFQSNIYKV